MKILIHYIQITFVTTILVYYSTSLNLLSFCQISEYLANSLLHGGDLGDLNSI